MNSDKNCVCSVDERVLRAYAEGRCHTPMTTRQREWCLNEAEWAGMGSYPKDEAPGNDKDLANWVLNAWNDYTKNMF